MEEWILDGFANGGDRGLLPADLLPADAGHLVQDMPGGSPVLQALDCDPVAGVNSDLIAWLELHLRQIARTLKNQALPARLLLKPQPAIG